MNGIAAVGTAPLSKQTELLVVVSNEIPQTSSLTTQTDNEAYYFIAGNTSTTWEMNNVLIRAEVVSLDSTVANNISSHILSGNSLKIYFAMYHTITQTFNVGAGEINLNIANLLLGYQEHLSHVTERQKQVKISDAFCQIIMFIRDGNYFFGPMIHGRTNDH